MDTRGSISESSLKQSIKKYKRRLSTKNEANAQKMPEKQPNLVKLKYKAVEFRMAAKVIKLAT
jgi:hypothetical protein